MKRFIARVDNLFFDIFGYFYYNNSHLFGGICMNIQRDRFVMIIAVFLFLFSLEARIYYYYAGQDINTSYESINIKNISAVNVSEKLQGVSTSLSFLYRKDEVSYHFKGVAREQEKVTENVSTPTWHLPTEMGIISQNPHYRHMALDITSPRGSKEVIYPVYDGVISGIYTDMYGALIVTILHNINGQKYTSQYVHLSRYKEGLYVGKPVSYLDPIGWMGTTGYSTGVHLHLAVLDCALFDANDANCKDLNGFFSYGKRRINEGYLGLGSHIIVPGSWNQRF